MSKAKKKPKPPRDRTLPIWTEKTDPWIGEPTPEGVPPWHEPLPLEELVLLPYSK